MRTIKTLICLMSMILTAKSSAMGFSDQELANPTNGPLPIAPEFAKKQVELEIHNIEEEIRMLELYRKLLQTKSEILESASESKAKEL